uniref:Uncharacterized protein n=1 Tax=Cacopsylla melanoneura TaxID=428564 RepID=A0A8D8UL28_9HEMI
MTRGDTILHLSISIINNNHNNLAMIQEGTISNNNLTTTTTILGTTILIVCTTPNSMILIIEMIDIKYHQDTFLTLTLTCKTMTFGDHMTLMTTPDHMIFHPTMTTIDGGIIVTLGMMTSEGTGLMMTVLGIGIEMMTRLIQGEIQIIIEIVDDTMTHLEMTTDMTGIAMMIHQLGVGILTIKTE